MNLAEINDQMEGVLEVELDRVVLLKIDSEASPIRYLGGKTDLLDGRRPRAVNRLPQGHVVSRVTAGTNLARLHLVDVMSNDFLEPLPRLSTPLWHGRARVLVGRPRRSLSSAPLRTRRADFPHRAPTETVHINSV